MFISTRDEIQSVIGKIIYFGQVDKDREVLELFSWFMLHELSVTQDTINDLIEVNSRGNNTISGYNPLEYLK